jgi:hypothetical protein
MGDEKKVISLYDVVTSHISLHLTNLEANTHCPFLFVMEAKIEDNYKICIKNDSLCTMNYVDIFLCYNQVKKALYLLFMSKLGVFDRFSKSKMCLEKGVGWINS